MAMPPPRGRNDRIALSSPDRPSNVLPVSLRRFPACSCRASIGIQTSRFIEINRAGERASQTTAELYPVIGDTAPSSQTCVGRQVRHRALLQSVLDFIPAAWASCMSVGSISSGQANHFCSQVNRVSCYPSKIAGTSRIGVILPSYDVKFRLKLFLVKIDQLNPSRPVIQCLHAGRTSLSPTPGRTKLLLAPQSLEHAHNAESIAR